MNINSTRRPPVLLLSPFKSTPFSLSQPPGVPKTSAQTSTPTSFNCQVARHRNTTSPPPCQVLELNDPSVQLLRRIALGIQALDLRLAVLGCSNSPGLVHAWRTSGRSRSVVFLRILLGVPIDTTQGTGIIYRPIAFRRSMGLPYMPTLGCFGEPM